MTNMKRTSVSLPPELAERVFALRKDDRYTRYSYSKLIRLLVNYGLEMVATPGESSRAKSDGTATAE